MTARRHGSLLLAVMLIWGLLSCTPQPEPKPSTAAERIPLVAEALAEPMETDFRRAEYAWHLLRLLDQAQSADQLHSFMRRQILQVILDAPLHPAASVGEAIAFEAKQPAAVGEEQVGAALRASRHVADLDEHGLLNLAEREVTVVAATGKVLFVNRSDKKPDFFPADRAEEVYRVSACEQRGTCAAENAAEEKRLSERSLAQQWHDIPQWMKWVAGLASIGIMLFARERVPPLGLTMARIGTALSALPFWPTAWELWSFDFGGNHDGAPSGIVIVIPLVYGLAFICTLLPPALIWLALTPADGNSPAMHLRALMQRARDWYAQRYGS